MPTPEEPEVDLHLQWTEAGEASVTTTHREAATAPLGEDAPAAGATATSPQDPAADARLRDVPSPDSLASAHQDCGGPDGLDAFQPVRERDAAIEAALDRLAEEPVSVVGRQVRDLRRAMLAGPLPDAEKRIEEVEVYLENASLRLQKQPPVDHPDMLAARALMLEALGLYSEICELLRTLPHGTDPLEGGDLCVRLECEAVRAMQRARDALVSAHPGTPPEA